MTPDAQAFAAVDRNGDGRLDLAAVAMGRPVWLMAGGGTATYHWKMIRPRGQATAGDQRINSFGVGGEISVRSGLTVQTQVMSGIADSLRSRHAHRHRRRANRLAERQCAGRVWNRRR